MVEAFYRRRQLRNDRGQPDTRDRSHRRRRRRKGRGEKCSHGFLRSAFVRGASSACKGLKCKPRGALLLISVKGLAVPQLSLLRAVIRFRGNLQTEQL